MSTFGTVGGAGLTLIAVLNGCATDGRRGRTTDEHVPKPLARVDGVSILDDDATESASEAVIGGTTTLDHPAIGWIGWCTATLVEPDILVSAAHCMDYASSESNRQSAKFTIVKSDGLHEYSVRQYRSRGSAAENDVLVMRLAESVPAEVATPLGLAAAHPAAGSTLTIYGFGCTDRRYDTDVRKRAFSYKAGEWSNNLCPGDSGGPVLNEANEIIAVNSAYREQWSGYTYQAWDVYGDVVTHRGWIEGVIAEWRSRPTPDPVAEPEPEPTPEWFDCRNGIWVQGFRQCDRYWDCSNGLDESGC